MHNLQFVWVKIQDVPSTPVRHASRLSGLRCWSPRTAADRRPHSDYVLGVCELRAADHAAICTQKSHLHAAALSIDGLHLKIGLHADSFHGEIRAKQWRTTGGGGLQNSLPPQFRRPSKILPNSTRLWKLLKIAEFGTPTPQDVRKKR